MELGDFGWFFSKYVGLTAPKPYSRPLRERPRSRRKMVNEIETVPMKTVECIAALIKYHIILRSFGGAYTILIRAIWDHDIANHLAIPATLPMHRFLMMIPL